MLCGWTCGRSAVEAAVPHHGRCSRWSAAGAERQRRLGCITVPLPRSVGRAENAPVGGGPKPGVHCAILGRCHRVLGRQFRATCGGSEGMVCCAGVNQQRPCPCCCGGQLWTVTRGFFGCGITGDLVGRLRRLGVMPHEQA